MPIDKYVDSRINGTVVTKLLNNLAAGTGALHAMAATFEKGASDGDGSVYRVFKGLNGALVPLMILVSNDALTGGTDFQLGLYRSELGAVLDADVLAAALNLSSAHNLGHLSALSGMTAIDVANLGKTLSELAGHTVATKLDAYDLALTSVTGGSAAGTISVIGIFGQC